MVTLHNSYRLSVVSQGYCSCRDKNNDPKCTCTHTCMGGLSLRGTQQVGSLHRKGRRITHRCLLETVTHLAMGWRHSVLGSLLECIPAPGGGFPWQNCCSKENSTWFLSEAPRITWSVWGSLSYTVMAQKVLWAEAPHWQDVQSADQGDLHFSFPPLRGAGGGRRRHNCVPAAAGATRYQPSWDRYSCHRGRKNI